MDIEELEEEIEKLEETTEEEESTQVVETSENTSYQTKETSKEPYNYFPVKEHLESRYFPTGVLGFAKPTTDEAFVNPDVYGQMRGVVKIHERLHLMYKHLNETSIRMMTNNLSGGPYIPTGMNY